MQGYYYDLKLGKLFIAEDEKAVVCVELVKEMDTSQFSQQLEKRFGTIRLEESELLAETAKQLREYFEGTRKKFTICLKPKGTSFQQKVWEALQTIPYGETRTYGQIAEAVGNGKASRAVGMANHNNPIMLLIPCHRVIGANKGLVGYAGGLEVKEWLLKLEAQSGS